MTEPYSREIIDDLQTYLDNHIPITRPMAIRVERATDHQLVIRAPLPPNHNDKGTGFAGSLYSAMVLAGWCFVSARLRREGIDAQVAVTAADIQYLHPVVDGFRAVCRLDEAGLWERFVAKLRKRRNYRIELPIEIENGGGLAVSMTGRYIAWIPREEEW